VLRVNSDLVNLLNSVQIALVIIEGDLKIRRFTTMAERVLNLIPSDVGRPIGHLKPNIDCPDLEDVIRSVMENVVPQEREVRDLQGRWYSLLVRPYKSHDNRIDGAVLALSDIDSTKRHDIEIRAARDLAEAIIDSTREVLVVLDAELRVVALNRAFAQRFRVVPEGARGKLLYEIADGQWDIPELRSRLAEIVASDKPLDVFEVDQELASNGRRRMRLNARRVRREKGLPTLVLLAIEDVAE